jgi:AraC-like DNA-binding protein
MEGSVGPRPAGGLEGLCATRDWVRAYGPVGGVELLRAWFGGSAFASHRHDTYAIGVTEVGVQTFDYRGRVESSRPGDVLVLHPDEAHDGRSGGEGGFGYRIVYIEPARIADAVRAITGRARPLPFVREPVSHNPTLAGAVADAFRFPLEALAVDELMVQFAEGLLEGARPGAARGTRSAGRAGSAGLTSAGLLRSVDSAALARGREYLDSRHTIVRSAELEAVTGLSRYELARQFRAVYGTSPYRYSLIRRLDFARKRLLEHQPLAELALLAGFADQAHFTRMFRATFGVTPARYARLHAAD